MIVRQADPEPIVLDVRDENRSPFIGATGVAVRVRRNSDGFYLDWTGNIYRSSGWTTLDRSTTAIDAVNAPGMYEVTGGYPTPSISNAVSDDHYIVIPVNTGAPDTVGAVLPPPHEFKVGFWADAIGLDCVVSATIGSASPDTLKLIGWLERQNIPVSSGLVSASIELRDASGVIVVPSTAMNGPDAQGIFEVEIPGVTLALSSNYYASITITDNIGSTKSYTATPTVG